MSDKGRFSFGGEGLEEPADAQNSDLVTRALAGTYRTNWSTLKHASQSSAFACLVNMETHLLPIAKRVVERNAQEGERAFLLALNHTNLVGGIALGAVGLIAFAQESFIRISYQLAEEIRLGRDRSRRAGSLDAAIIKSIAALEKASFPKRCEMLLKCLDITGSAEVIQDSIDLMAFRNSIAHDSPQLHLNSGQRVTSGKGSQRIRKEEFGVFSTLESQSCAIRLKHVKAAIDAHDQLVMLCVKQSPRNEWVEAIKDFESGIGLQIKEAFAGRGWYSALESAARTWEEEFQAQTEAPLESLIEMRNAIMRRERIRRSNQPKSV